METRGIITIEEKTVVLPDAEVWMTTGEIAGLFYQEAKGYTEIYGMETVIALSFRFDTGQAALFRKWIARTMACSKKEPTVLFLHHPHGAYC